jgi:hypothetical protein
MGGHKAAPLQVNCVGARLSCRFYARPRSPLNPNIFILIQDVSLGIFDIDYSPSPLHSHNLFTIHYPPTPLDV